MRVPASPTPSPTDPQALTLSCHHLIPRLQVQRDQVCLRGTLQWHRHGRGARPRPPATSPLRRRPPAAGGRLGRLGRRRLSAQREYLALDRLVALKPTPAGQQQAAAEGQLLCQLATQTQVPQHAQPGCGTCLPRMTPPKPKPHPAPAPHTHLMPRPTPSMTSPNDVPTAAPSGRTAGRRRPPAAATPCGSMCSTPAGWRCGGKTGRAGAGKAARVPSAWRLWCGLPGRPKRECRCPEPPPHAALPCLPPQPVHPGTAHQWGGPAAARAGRWRPHADRPQRQPCAAGRAPQPQLPRPQRPRPASGAASRWARRRRLPRSARQRLAARPLQCPLAAPRQQWQQAAGRWSGGR